MPPALHWSTAQDYVPRGYFIQICSSIQGFNQEPLGLFLFFGDLVVLGTRTLRKGGVMIRWLGHLGRCVGTSYHVSFCCCCRVYSDCVLGDISLCTMTIYITLHDVAVVTFCKILFGVSCASLVLHRSSGEPRPTSHKAQHTGYESLVERVK